MTCNDHNIRQVERELTPVEVSKMVSPAVNRSPTGKEHLIAGFLGGLIPTGPLEA